MLEREDKFDFLYCTITEKMAAGFFNAINYPQAVLAADAFYHRLGVAFVGCLADLIKVKAPAGEGRQKCVRKINGISALADKLIRGSLAYARLTGVTLFSDAFQFLIGH